MNIRAADGSAPLGFALVAPIGLLLLFASFDMTFLAWERSLRQRELNTLVNEISRNPNIASSTFDQWKLSNQSELMSATLQTKNLDEVTVFILSAKFQKSSFSGLTFNYLVRTERVSE